MRKLLIFLFLLAQSMGIWAQNAAKDMVVLPMTDTTGIAGTDLGTVKFRDKILSSNCTYDEVIARLKAEAVEMGGNLMKITTHKKPDYWSTCHRITAEVFRVTDPHLYEKMFEWSAARRLTAADFKGLPDPADTISAAATCAGFSFATNRVTMFKSTKFFVACEFDCTRSWMRPEFVHDSSVLQHEQTHFDIAELYARKMLHAFDEEQLNVTNLNRSKDIYNHYFEEYKMRQDQYDTETDHGRDAAQQQKWKAAIATNLKELAAYARE